MVRVTIPISPYAIKGLAQILHDYPWFADALAVALGVGLVFAGFALLKNIASGRFFKK